MTTEPGSLVNGAVLDRALADVAAIEDPVARERAARDLQAALTEAIAEPLTRTKAVRQQAVLELRQTLTLTKVAELLNLSVGRVDQLAKGK